MSDNEIDETFHVVGIGASAGGLEALEKFFVNMPAKSGLAFVVVQHLSPDYKSLMVELLSKRTTMTVHHVEDGLAVQPNNIYIIPPRKNITIFHRKLFLTERGTEHLHLPIDIFLNSLAEDVGEKAIAIILSGTGSDGTRGVRAVKESGGMVMVQDERTAKFDGMPRSAIATKLVDYVLPPEKMPEELVKYIKHPTRLHDNTIVQSVLSKDGDNLSKIFSMLRSRTGVDFTYYKQTTMLRRVERRMSINQIDTLSDYVHYLYQNSHEVKTLYKELLIGVTRFFRDPEAFFVLENEVIPAIFSTKSRQDEIRVWIAGCSTGEEAYSLAILFSEYMERTGTLAEVKIFATDIDREALDFAGRGSYTESITADIPLERLQNYFVRQGDTYEVLHRIREMVIFAQQDITKDPPFSKIDLISCRNVLIYLQPVLQRKVLSAFQFALRPGGFLFQGTSESVGDMEDAFQTFNAKWRIYQYRGGFRPTVADTVMIPSVGYQTRTRLDRQISELGSDDAKLVEKTYRGLIESFMPPTIVTDESGMLLHAFGDIDGFLQVPSGGPFSNNILKMVRGNLSIPLNTAVRRALKDNSDVVYRKISVESRNSKQYIDLVVKIFMPARTQQRLLLVQFQEVDRPEIEPDFEVLYDAEGTARQRILDLEQELQYTKENLQATIEELETANEELQATNEELLAANEELQSTNEELQSVNEELITVNTEHQLKIQELLDLNADMNNLFASTDVGTIFLDRHLHIRKFTPAAQREINLLEKDVGRPISHIAHNIAGCDLVEEAREVLESLTSREQEVSSNNGRKYLLKIRPYYTLNNIVGGVIIVLVDITDNSELKMLNEQLRQLSEERRLAQDELRASQQFLLSSLDALQSHIAILDEAGKIIAVNKAWRDFADDNNLGWADYGVGHSYLEASESPRDMGDQYAQGMTNGIRDVISGDLDHFQMEYPCHSPKEHRWFIARVTSFKIKNKLRIVVSHTNITEIKMAEASLRQQHLLAENIVNTVRQSLLILNDHLEVEVANDAFFAFFGAKPTETIGKPVFELGDGQWDNKELRELLEGVLARQGSFETFSMEKEFPLIGHKKVVLNGRLLKQASDKPNRILLAIEEIKSES